MTDTHRSQGSPSDTSRGKHFASNSSIQAQSRQSGVGKRFADQTQVIQGQGAIHSNSAAAVQKPDYHGAGKKAVKKERQNHSKAQRIISTLLLVVGVILIGVALYLGISKWQDDRAAIAEYEGYKQYVTEPENTTDVPRVDWKSLRAINEDIIGWIMVPGTSINYPIVQGKDNDEYLRTTPERTSRVSGSIFLDSESSRKFDDYNTIIYGHHMNNGTMFHDIRRFIDQQYFNEHQTIYVLTPEKNIILKPVAAYETNGSDETVRHFAFETADQFRSYTQALVDRSAIVAPGTNSQEITHVYQFSTCTDDISDGRTILVCVEDKDAKAKVTGDAINDGLEVKE